jgi:hypothetical protein
MHYSNYDAIRIRFKDMLQPADFSSMSDMENYAEYSQSSLLYLMLEAMNIKHEQTEYAASHVGVCHGILVLLKAHTYHASQVCIHEADRPCMSLSHSVF